jgi:hypothetical protein
MYLMPLPFIDQTKEGTTSAYADPIKREPDPDILEHAAKDLLHGIHTNDVKAIAEAMRAAFDLYQNE